MTSPDELYGFISFDFNPHPYVRDDLLGKEKIEDILGISIHIPT